MEIYSNNQTVKSDIYSSEDTISTKPDSTEKSQKQPRQLTFITLAE